jgi:hypothetical protein
MSSDEQDKTAAALAELKREIERLSGATPYLPVNGTGLPAPAVSSNPSATSGSAAGTVWREVLSSTRLPAASALAETAAAQKAGSSWLNTAFPLFGRLFSLFGGGAEMSEPTRSWTVVDLPKRAPEFGFSAAGGREVTQADRDLEGRSRLVRADESGAGARPVEIRVSALDSQSFLDRKQDIAEAVRLALLESHRLSDVVSDY